MSPALLWPWAESTQTRSVTTSAYAAAFSAAEYCRPIYLPTSPHKTGDTLPSEEYLRRGEAWLTPDERVQHPELGKPQNPKQPLRRHRLVEYLI